MIRFFNAISTGDENPQGDAYKKFIVLGDSISRGTSDGVGVAGSSTLYEWNGGQIYNRTGDVINAVTGSWMPSFAVNLKSLTSKKVLMCTNGSGGSEFYPYLDSNNWSTSGNLYDTMVNNSNSMINAFGDIDGVIIILGINDARGTAAISDIRTAAFSLIDRLNTDFNTSNIFIVQIGRKESGVNQRVLDVRDIISNGVDGLVETYNNVYLSASLADYPDSDFYDNLHLNQTANNLLGTQISDYIFNLT